MNKTQDADIYCRQHCVRLTGQNHDKQTQAKCHRAQTRQDSQEHLGTEVSSCVERLEMTGQKVSQESFHDLIAMF